VQVQWDESTGSVVGCCGRKCTLGCNNVGKCKCLDRHHCQLDYAHDFGDGDNAAAACVAFCSNSKVGTMARVVMIAPNHKLLPALPVYFGPVCGAFTHKDVHKQWKTVEKMYNDIIKPVLLGPLAGNASDGDPRRRKLQQADMRGHLEETASVELYGLQVPSFTYKAQTLDGVVRGAHDQDFIHCGKKLINHLVHARRTLKVGNNEFAVATMEQFAYILPRNTLVERGWREADLERDRLDLQNWESAQRLMSRKSIACLQVALPEIPMITGLLDYILICRRYTCIFLSETLSLRDRVVSAGYVAQYLRLWRLSTSHTDGLKVSVNYLSNQTHEDVMLSCHSFVLLLMVARDYCPGVEFAPSILGTDPLENFFRRWEGCRATLGYLIT
jgi:hypothetical protein